MAESKQPGTYHPEGANVGLATLEIDRVNRSWGLRREDVEYVIDPSAVARSASTQTESVEQEFADRGIYTTHGENAVEAGVLRIRGRGEAGALVVASEGNDALLWEADRYRVQERNDGKFDVVKEHDHVMDAWRYALMHRAWAPPVAYELANFGLEYASGPPKPVVGAVDPWL